MTRLSPTLVLGLFAVSACSSSEVSPGPGTDPGVPAEPTEPRDPRSDPEPSRPTSSLPTSIRQVGPAGGYVPSILFLSSSEVFLSADDTGGLFRSTDGGRRWALVGGFPRDHSSYALASNPQRTETLYAPSYAGLGLARSLDGGDSWEVFREGLPDEPDSARVFDLAISEAGDRLFLATVSGLYRSDDDGESWSLVFSEPVSTVEISLDDSTVYAGTPAGQLMAAPMPGDRLSPFATCTDSEGLALGIEDLTLTRKTLYVGCAQGTVIAIDEEGLTYLSRDATPFGSGLFTRLHVQEGMQPGQDRLLVGTTAGGAEPYGVFRSFDSGRSFERVFPEISVFSIAVDPRDPETVIVGGAPDRVWRSENIEDGTPIFTDVSDGVFAHAGVVAVDPSDPERWLMSSTVFLSGPRDTLFETEDGGERWRAIPFQDPGAPELGQLAVTALALLDDTIYLATPRGLSGAREPAAVYRSTNGSSGPWERDLTANVVIGSLAWGLLDTEPWLFGSTLAAPDQTDLGIYARSAHDSQWHRGLIGTRLNRIVVSDATGRIQVWGLGEDAHLIEFDGTPAGLDMSCAFGAPLREGESLTSAARNEDDTRSMWFGTDQGRLLSLTGIQGCEGEDFRWRQISTPLSDSEITGVFSLGRGQWLLGGLTFSERWPADSVSGLFMSGDDGLTFSRLDNTRLSSTIPLTMARIEAGRFLVGTVAAGILVAE